MSLCNNCTRKKDGSCNVHVQNDTVTQCSAYNKQRCGNCKHFSGERKPCGAVAPERSVNVQSGMGGACNLHVVKLQEIPSNVVKKETGTMVTNAIVRLADTQFNREVVEFGGLNVDLADALKELQTEDRKAAAKDAAQQVMAVLKQADAHIEFQVGEIQRYRRQEASAKNDIREFNKARAYGLATNNFVPLGVLCGTINAHGVTNKDLLKIDESKLPEGWDKKPGSAKAEAAAQ